MKKILLVLPILLACLISSSAYGSGEVESEAIIQWNTLSIVTDPGVSIAWFNQQSFASAGSYPPHYYDQQAGWVNASAGTGNVKAYTNDDELYALTRTSGPFLQSWAQRNAQFIVSGAGNITFSVDYVVSNNILSYDPNFPSIGIWSAVYFQDDSARVDYPPFLFSESGTFVSSHYYADGQEGRFTAMAITEGYVGVPEASTFALLCFSLVGLVGFRRKLTK